MESSCTGLGIQHDRPGLGLRRYALLSNLLVCWVNGCGSMQLVLMVVHMEAIVSPGFAADRLVLPVRSLSPSLR